MNEWLQDTKDIRQMQKYYFSILWELASIYIMDKDGLHRMMKIGFHKKTTTKMWYDEWYEYLDNVHFFIQEVRGIYFDTDRYFNEWVWYYILPYAMIDDYLLS